MKVWIHQPYIHLSVAYPSWMLARPNFAIRSTLFIKDRFDIWHKSSTKHKEVRPDWDNKHDNANYAPACHMEGLPVAQATIFKGIFDQVHKDLDCELFHSELKRHNVSLYVYYLATDNIYIVLENDNVVLVKGLKRAVNAKFSGNKHLIKTPYNKLKSKEIIFQQYRKNLARAGVFRWITNIQKHQRYYYTLDNSLLFTESIRKTTQILLR